MEETGGVLPARGTSPDSVSVLSISFDESTHASLRQIFSHTRWQLYQVSSFKDALDFLRQSVTSILICEAKLLDGSWKDLLARISESPTSPLLIVSSRGVDYDLWNEVLALGAYDVLSQPFDSAEVTRIVSLAWLHWKEQSKAEEEKTGEQLSGSHPA